MTSKEQVDKLTEEYLNKVSEFTDSVRVFATITEEANVTHSFNVGRGNYYAQRGNILEWMNVQDERERKMVREEE